jgi:3-isopropylmalate/(R)-2-methylmalate dehydratase small subunit
MEKFTTLTSKAVPVPIRNVDTDMIIPANFLKSVSREGYGENVFARLREDDPEFPFNQEKYQGAQVLIADDNFGCGSSREHAVWALTGWGIRAIIGKSFADIFASNSSKNGLLLVKLEDAVVDNIMQEATSGDYQVTVSLEDQLVTLPSGETLSFDYDPFAKHCLLSGLDDIDYVKTHQQSIEEFRQKQQKDTFFSALEPNR